MYRHRLTDMTFSFCLKGSAKAHHMPKNESRTSSEHGLYCFGSVQREEQLSHMNHVRSAQCSRPVNRLQENVALGMLAHRFALASVSMRHIADRLLETPVQ